MPNQTDAYCETTLAMAFKQRFCAQYKFNLLLKGLNLKQTGIISRKFFHFVLFFGDIEMLLKLSHFVPKAALKQSRCDIIDTTK